MTDDPETYTIHEALPLAEGPATIRPMPPSPETSRRHWSMYCDVCGIEEGMAESATERWLIKRVYEHNFEHHAARPTPPEDAARDLRSFTAIDETVHAWQAWDGLWRTIPQSEAEQTRVLMTWRKRELVTALVAERQAELQRNDAALAAVPADGETVTTVEELDALPEFTVGITGPPGGPAVAWQKCDGVLISTGGRDFPIGAYTGDIPLRVLYRPIPESEEQR